MACSLSNWIQLVLLCAQRALRRGTTAYSHVVCRMEDLRATDPEKVYWTTLYRKPNTIGRRHAMDAQPQIFRTMACRRCRVLSTARLTYQTNGEPELPCGHSSRLTDALFLGNWSPRYPDTA